MKIFSSQDVIGDTVKLAATNKKHFAIGNNVSQKLDVEQSFGSVLNNALKKVNDSQIEADKITQKMIATPDEVNIHDVMIAAQKAKMSLEFVKAIRDRVVKAYQEIMNMR